MYIYSYNSYVWDVIVIFELENFQTYSCVIIISF